MSKHFHQNYNKTPKTRPELTKPQQFMPKSKELEQICTQKGIEKAVAEALSQIPNTNEFSWKSAAAAIICAFCLGSPLAAGAVAKAPEKIAKIKVSSVSDSDHNQTYAKSCNVYKNSAAEKTINTEKSLNAQKQVSVNLEKRVYSSEPSFPDVNFVLSKGEKLLPVAPVNKNTIDKIMNLEDMVVENNRENYAASPEKFLCNGTLPVAFVNTEVSTSDIALKAVILYFVDNPVPFDTHEHDIEYVIMKKDMAANKMTLALSHHIGLRYYELPISAEPITVYVEKDGHALSLQSNDFIWPGPGFQLGGRELKPWNAVTNPDGYVVFNNMDSPANTTCDEWSRYKSGPTDHAFGDLLISGDMGLFKLIKAVDAKKEKIAMERAKVARCQNYLYFISLLNAFDDMPNNTPKEIYAKADFSGDVKFRLEDTSLGKIVGEHSPPVTELPLSNFAQNGNSKGAALQVISDFKNYRYAVQAIADSKYSLAINLIGTPSSDKIVSVSDVEIKAGQTHYLSIDFSNPELKSNIGIDDNSDGTVDRPYDSGSDSNSGGSGTDMNLILASIIGASAALGTAGYLWHRRRRGGARQVDANIPVFPQQYPQAYQQQQVPAEQYELPPEQQGEN